VVRVCELWLGRLLDTSCTKTVLLTRMILDSRVTFQVCGKQFVNQKQFCLYWSRRARFPAYIRASNFHCMLSLHVYQLLEGKQGIIGNGTRSADIRGGNHASSLSLRLSKNLSVHHDYVQIRVVNEVLRHRPDQGFFPPLFRVVRHDEHLRVHLRCAALDHVRDWFPIRFQNRVQFDWLGKRGHVNPTVRQLACE
jgi:hypothetical protein